MRRIRFRKFKKIPVKMGKIDILDVVVIGKGGRLMGKHKPTENNIALFLMTARLSCEHGLLRGSCTNYALPTSVYFVTDGESWCDCYVAIDNDTATPEPHELKVNTKVHPYFELSTNDRTQIRSAITEYLEKT